jgi:hypothetical protein
MEWFSDAGCKSVRTVEFFENFEHASKADRTKVLSICASCLVRKECESYADSFKDTYGVWGGYFYKDGKKKDALKIIRPSAPVEKKLVKA